MGRGRSGIVNQSEKKITKTHIATGKDKIVWFHTATTKNSSTVPLPEEFLKALGQLNPRDFVNIIVN